MKCLNIDAASETESEVRIDYEENYIMNFITKRSKKLKPITLEVVTDFSSTKKTDLAEFETKLAFQGIRL